MTKVNYGKIDIIYKDRTLDRLYFKIDDADIREDRGIISNRLVIPVKNSKIASSLMTVYENSHEVSGQIERLFRCHYTSSIIESKIRSLLDKLKQNK